MANQSEPIPPDNEIWYTTTTGQVAVPYKTDAFDANIISNTYHDNKGIIRFDGPVTSIGYAAFYSKTSFSSIIMSDSIQTVDGQALSNMWNLSRVRFSKNLISIGNYGLLKAYLLEEVIIPDTVTFIGSQVFNHCTKLSKVICLAITPPTIYYEVFANNASERKIYVPAGSVNAYKSAQNWSAYANDIEPIPE